MILLPLPRAIYAAVEPVNLRAGFFVLHEIAVAQLGHDTMNSAIVLFFNRTRNRCKLLFHDGTGFVILFKKLDRGRFHTVTASSPASKSLKIESAHLELLLAGSLLTARR